MIIRAGFTGDCAYVAPKAKVAHFYSNGKCFMFRAFDNHEDAVKAAQEYINKILFQKNNIQQTKRV